MQSPAFVLISLTAFLVYISLVFFCFHASFCHWPSFFLSYLNAALQIACSWSCTLTVFSCGKRLDPFSSLTNTCVLKISVGRTSMAWTQLSYHPFSHPSIVEKHHFFTSSPQNHCAQEIGSWSSFPSFSFKLFKRNYESASPLVVYHHLHTYL